MGTALLQAEILGVIVDCSFWASALFVPAVSLFWPWWRHPYGRAAMSVDVLLALAFLPAELQRLFAFAMPGAFGWFEIAVLGLIPVRTAWLAWQVWKLQRLPRPRAGAVKETGQ